MVMINDIMLNINVFFLYVRWENIQNFLWKFHLFYCSQCTTVWMDELVFSKKKCISFHIFIRVHYEPTKCVQTYNALGENFSVLFFAFRFFSFVFICAHPNTISLHRLVWDVSQTCLLVGYFFFSGGCKSREFLLSMTIWYMKRLCITETHLCCMCLNAIL